MFLIPKIHLCGIYQKKFKDETSTCVAFSEKSLRPKICKRNIEILMLHIVAFLCKHTMTNEKVITISRNFIVC